MTEQHATPSEPIKFAYWVPNVSGLVRELEAAESAHERTPA
jgi:hypothetical protein